MLETAKMHLNEGELLRHNFVTNAVDVLSFCLIVRSIGQHPSILRSTIDSSHFSIRDDVRADWILWIWK